MNTVRPPYYKVLWHKCNRCFTHYTSEEPHLRAYLCDDCWKAIPHFTVKTKQKEKKMKRENIISAETWVLFYFILGMVLLGWSLYNIMVNEI